MIASVKADGERAPLVRFASHESTVRVQIFKPVHADVDATQKHDRRPGDPLAVCIDHSTGGLNATLLRRIVRRLCTRDGA